MGIQIIATLLLKSLSISKLEMVFNWSSFGSLDAIYTDFIYSNLNKARHFECISVRNCSFENVNRLHDKYKTALTLLSHLMYRIRCG